MCLPPGAGAGDSASSATALEIETDDVRFRPKKSEVERLWAGNLKAKKLLNWEPNFAGVDGLRRGLEQTINWFTQPENLSVYKRDHYTI